MLTIFGSKQRSSDGINRRNFLKIGAFGAGLTLTDLLRLRGSAGGAAPPRTKSAIMIYLAGGPSHIDMYDLKPDAPVEYRGDFKPIPTNVPGVQICEHFPLQAKMWDKLACIRSVSARDGAHTDVEISTGYQSQAGNPSVNHPSFGSFVSRLRGNSAVPPFVSLHGTALLGVSKGLEPGYLGAAHRPFTPSGPGMDNLQLPKDITLDRLEDRKRLLAGFDSLRRDSDSNGAMAGMDSFTGRAFDMVASGTVRKALDLTQEDPNVRARYKNVEQFLLARRLVEAGVGCVTLSVGAFGWDTHEKNFATLRRLLPDVDLGLSNLIQDLHERGLDQDVVTVMWGEFGRTPKIDKNAGRGHWSPAMSVLVAGGGLKMGQMVGATTARAEVPRDRPYNVPHVLATAYRVLGIDPSMTVLHPSGRPMYILDERDPVSELL